MGSRVVGLSRAASGDRVKSFVTRYFDRSGESVQECGIFGGLGGLLIV